VEAKKVLRSNDSLPSSGFHDGEVTHHSRAFSKSNALRWDDFKFEPGTIKADVELHEEVGLTQD
jgi:hypothetical protein